MKKKVEKIPPAHLKGSISNSPPYIPPCIPRRCIRGIWDDSTDSEKARGEMNLRAKGSWQERRVGAGRVGYESTRRLR